MLSSPSPPILMNNNKNSMSSSLDIDTRDVWVLILSVGHWSQIVNFWKMIFSKVAHLYFLIKNSLKIIMVNIKNCCTSFTWNFWNSTWYTLLFFVFPLKNISVIHLTIGQAHMSRVTAHFAIPPRWSVK